MLNSQISWHFLTKGALELYYLEQFLYEFKVAGPTNVRNEFETRKDFIHNILKNILGVFVHKFQLFLKLKTYVMHM